MRLLRLLKALISPAPKPTTPALPPVQQRRPGQVPRLEDLSPYWEPTHLLLWGLIEPYPDESTYLRALRLQDAIRAANAAGRHLPMEGLIPMLEAHISAYERGGWLPRDLTPLEVIDVCLQKAKMTQLALSQRTGINQGNLSRMLCGKSPLSTRNIKALAEALGIDPKYLMYGTVDKVETKDPVCLVRPEWAKRRG